MAMIMGVLLHAQKTRCAWSAREEPDSEPAGDHPDRSSGAQRQRAVLAGNEAVGATRRLVAPRPAATRAPACASTRRATVPSGAFSGAWRMIRRRRASSIAYEVMEPAVDDRRPGDWMANGGSQPGIRPDLPVRTSGSSDALRRSPARRHDQGAGAWRDDCAGGTYLLGGPQHQLRLRPQLLHTCPPELRLSMSAQLRRDDSGVAIVAAIAVVGIVSTLVLLMVSVGIVAARDSAGRQKPVGRRCQCRRSRRRGYSGLADRTAHGTPLLLQPRDAHQHRSGPDDDATSRSSMSMRPAATCRRA